MALLDGDAELDALHHAFEALWVVALGGADKPFGHHPSGLGQGEHDAAVWALDTQVDLVLRGEGVGYQLERVVHEALPLAGNMH